MSETYKIEGTRLSLAITNALMAQGVLHPTRKQLGAIADAVQLLCSAFEPGAEEREQQAEATLNALYPHAEDHGESVVVTRAAPKKEKARKTGGSFQHSGTIVSRFRTLAGQERVVLEFDAPVAGMLHIYRPDQLEIIQDKQDPPEDLHTTFSR